MNDAHETLLNTGIIDDTFKGVGNPLEIHRLGREDLTENRPGDILVKAVEDFTAAGGFRREGDLESEIAVNTTIAVKGRSALGSEHQGSGIPTLDFNSESGEDE